MYTAKVAGYTRTVSRPRRKVLFKVYAEITGDNTVQPVTCGQCVLNVLKELYDIYWNNYPPDEINADESHENGLNKQEEEVDDAKKESKPKRSRPLSEG